MILWGLTVMDANSLIQLVLNKYLSLRNLDSITREKDLIFFFLAQSLFPTG